MFMKIIYCIAGILFLMSCNQQKDSILADDQLTPSQKEAVKKSIIRYVSKGPDNVSAQDRFKPDYDKYYEGNAKRCFLEFYTVKGGYHYFLVTQPAASLVEKRHATGGRFMLNDKGEITEYEEIFRTWKMTPKELKTKSELLFRELIEGKSMERYYTKHAGDQYIEFPDDRTYFDKESRSWKTK